MLRLQPGFRGGQADRRNIGEGGVGSDCSNESVTTPVFRIGEHHRIRHHGSDAEFSRRSENGMSLLAGAKLREESVGATGFRQLFKETDVRGEDEQALTIPAGGRIGRMSRMKARGKADLFSNLSDPPTYPT
jgi:hypothetical protein